MTIFILIIITEVKSLLWIKCALSLKKQTYRWYPSPRSCASKLGKYLTISKCSLLTVLHPLLRTPGGTKFPVNAPVRRLPWILAVTGPWRHKPWRQRWWRNLSEFGEFCSCRVTHLFFPGRLDLTDLTNYESLHSTRVIHHHFALAFS